MDKDCKLFFQCVESMRTAEREYEKNPTASCKAIVKDLHAKCDAWIKWFHEKEQGQTSSELPAFIGKLSKGKKQPELSKDVLARLAENHTPDEIERFVGMFG